MLAAHQTSQWAFSNPFLTQEGASAPSSRTAVVMTPPAAVPAPSLLLVPLPSLPKSDHSKGWVWGQHQLSRKHFLSPTCSRGAEQTCPFPLPTVCLGMLVSSGWARCRSGRGTGCPASSQPPAQEGDRQCTPKHLGSSLWGRNGGQSLEEGFLLLAGDETILAPTTAELNGAARREKRGREIRHRGDAETHCSAWLKS